MPEVGTLTADSSSEAYAVDDVRLHERCSSSVAEGACASSEMSPRCHHRSDEERDLGTSSGRRTSWTLGVSRVLHVPPVLGP